MSSKHVRTREYVGEPLVDAEDETTKGAVTPVKKAGTVRVVLGVSDHEFLVGSSRVPDSGRSTRAPSVDVSLRSPVEVDIFSPCSLSPISSPVRTSPVFMREEREFDAEH